MGLHLISDLLPFKKLVVCLDTYAFKLQVNIIFFVRFSAYIKNYSSMSTLLVAKND